MDRDLLATLGRCLVELGRQIDGAAPPDPLRAAEIRSHVEALAETLSVEEGRCLVLDGRERKLRLPSGRSISLARSRAPWLILEHLAFACIDAPGAPVDRETLVAVGWPDEVIRQDAAAARVYFVIRQLRKAGLEDLLLTGGGGYYIDPSVRVVLSEHLRLGRTASKVRSRQPRHAQKNRTQDPQRAAPGSVHPLS